MEIVPAFVQNRCFARNRWDTDVRALCETHDIIYQGFSLFTANRQVLSSPRLIAIARCHSKTLPQVVFRFAQQVGMIPLTGTSDADHMREDLAAFDFEFDPNEIERIENIAM